MKRFLMFAIFAIIFMATSTVQAGERGLYFGASAGYGIVMDVQDDEDPDTEISLDPGPNFSLYAGFDMGALRVEGEIGYATYDFDEIVSTGSTVAAGGDATALKFFANVYYDIEMPSFPVTPYVGLGLGVLDSDSEVVVSGKTFESDDTEFSFQFMAGVGLNLTDDLILTAGYRFIGTAEFDEDILVHDLVIGVRYML